MGDHMENSLICPNQLRSNGLIVDECPRHLAPLDAPSSHSIFSPQEEMRIPLVLRGVTSGFQTRTPTKLEIETCRWIHLADDKSWDPHSEEHQEQEEAFIDNQNVDQVRFRARNIYALSTYPRNRKY
jgi:hypothetical protein